MKEGRKEGNRGMRSLLKLGQVYSVTMSPLLIRCPHTHTHPLYTLYTLYLSLSLSLPLYSTPCGTTYRRGVHAGENCCGSLFSLPASFLTSFFTLFLLYLFLSLFFFILPVPRCSFFRRVPSDKKKEKRKKRGRRDHSRYIHIYIYMFDRVKTNERKIYHPPRNIESKEG